MNIWYAGYGSNLLRERFLTYLRGGPVPVSGRIQHGARNGADPQADRPYRIDRPMAFGGDSKSWRGGGLAFVDPHRIVEGDTLGRVWLVTEEQLADTWAQENGEKVGPKLDIAALTGHGSLDLGRGRYRRLEYLGMLEGLPVATITCETVPELNAAGAAYSEVVGRGLMSTWGMSAAEASTYVATRTGNRGVLSPPELALLLDGPLSKPRRSEAP